MIGRAVGSYHTGVIEEEDSVPRTLAAGRPRMDLTNRTVGGSYCWASRIVCFGVPLDWPQ